MSQVEKTKDQLLEELDMLRQRIDQLEMAEDGLRENGSRINAGKVAFFFFFALHFLACIRVGVKARAEFSLVSLPNKRLPPWI